ncbi:MAG: hypothetical protein M3414_00740 [Pseudomonadota bacterium]|nr:hypothetical protein [Pseudomonadota bacterium]
MRMFIRGFLAAGLFAIVGVAFASNNIKMEPPPEVVTAGEVLTFHGNQRFNQGQLRNLYFFVGVELVSPTLVNASSVRLTVPDLSPGVYTVRIVKHEDHAGRDIVQFSQDIEIGGELVLATITDTISPGGGRLTLPGVARVELTENGARAPVNLTVEHVLSPGETTPFLSYLKSEGIPAVASDTLIRIFATERISGFIGLRVRVPDEVRDALDAGLEPEIYAEIPSLSTSEDVGEYIPLRADFDRITGELTAPFSGNYFHDSANLPDVNSTTTAVKQALPQFTGRIRVSVREFKTRPLLVTAAVSFPDAPAIEAGARSTLNLDARLDIKVPLSLRNQSTQVKK